MEIDRYQIPYHITVITHQPTLSITIIHDVFCFFVGGSSSSSDDFGPLDNQLIMKLLLADGLGFLENVENKYATPRILSVISV